jgi:hypothetical protein
MLVCASREFRSTPAKDNQAAFETISGHVSVIDTSGRFLEWAIWERGELSAMSKDRGKRGRAGATTAWSVTQ